MKRFFLKYSFLIAFVFLIPKGGKAQGCSDAGVCSVGSLNLVHFKFELLPSEDITLISKKAEDTYLKGYENDSILGRKSEMLSQNDIKVKKDTLKKQIDKKKHQNYSRFPKAIFLLSTQYGLGDNSTVVTTTQIETNIRIHKKGVFVQAKVPYSFISGNLASVSGLNDITLSLSGFAFQKTKSNLSVTAGVKIPTGNANNKENSLPLPMVYQTSLGSTDLLLGMKYTYKRWDVTAGYQHSFNKTKNEYLHNSIVINSTEYNSYFESNKIKRADDVIFRINRNFRYKKIHASAGTLFIYHIANDTYTNINNERVEFKGSEGLTLNLNFAGVYSVSKKVDVLAIFAAPIIVREARPDGLTRSFVSQIGIQYKFF